MAKKFSLSIIIAGIITVGFMSAFVMAQEIELGATGGTPEITLTDQAATGETIIRLNDGTNVFQIFDVQNARSNFVILDNGNIGLGDETAPPQDVSVACTGAENCSLQLKASNGKALNVIRSLSGGDVTLRMVDNQVTGSASGDTKLELTLLDDGTACFKRQGGASPCFLTFDLTGGANDLKIYDKNGACVINC